MRWPSIKPLFLGLLCHMLLSQHVLAGDVLIADFEGENFGEWQVSGDALGERPTALALPAQSREPGTSAQASPTAFTVVPTLRE